MGFGTDGGFLVITRDHGSFGGRHQVEMLPTDLPELFKHARDLLEPRDHQNHQYHQIPRVGFGGPYLNGAPFFARSVRCGKMIAPRT